MNNLRVLIWNDSDKQAAAWATYAKDDDFVNVERCVSKDISSVLKEYIAFRPDVLVLDFMDDDRETPIGGKIAEAIRRLDPLAPIVVLSRRPEVAYTEMSDLRRRGFAGVYPEKVAATSGKFRDLVVGESLLLKHLLQPDYCLARAAGLALAAYKRWDDAQPIAEALRACIQRLPAAGSIESWHPMLVEGIHKALKSREWHTVAAKYLEACQLFEKSDPFYMAGSTSRRHLSHNVQVCLLGLVILLEDGPVRVAALGDVSLIDAVLIWCCIGTAHDAAYLSEHLGQVSTKLAALAATFAPIVGAAPPPSWPWPTTHHAKVGADLWRPNAATGEEAKAIESICEGIERHDAKRLGGMRVSCSEWNVFLAVLCDELQDWQRNRPEATGGVANTIAKEPWKDSPWRIVEPLRIELSRDEKSSCELTLELMIVDHSPEITETDGSPNTALIGNRLEEIVSTLQASLVSATQFRVTLRAHFLSRIGHPIIISRVLPTS